MDRTRRAESKTSMQYRHKKVAITGVPNSFIATELQRRLKEAGADTEFLAGDIRDIKTFDKLTFHHDYLFHFGSPSSQVLFKRNPEYCVDVTINGFKNAIKACRENGVKLIYPSTGLLSQGDTNEYARCKKLCEDMAVNIDSLGLRIFATYGPQEAHKRDYASVPFLFIRDMVEGKKPYIFGDGEQVRDMIYIDDTVNAIMILAEEANERIIDVGTGKSTSFNRVINLTNKAMNTDIKPVYADKPGGYVQETSADPTVLHKYYIPRVSIEEGIKNLIKELEQ